MIDLDDQRTEAVVLVRTEDISLIVVHKPQNPNAETLKFTLMMRGGQNFDIELNKLDEQRLSDALDERTENAE